MRYIEELSMNAWPSFQTVLYDGWVIRFAKGYTKRSNSVNPLYHSTEDVYKKVEQCEQLFKKLGIRTTFKMSREIFPYNLDNVLEKCGYTSIDSTSVQVIDLSGFQGYDTADIKVEKNFNNGWLESYCRLNSVGEDNRKTLSKMLENIVPDKYFVSLQRNGNVVACGLGVMERGYMGLFDIIVDKDYRNLGYGEKLIREMLEVGKSKGAGRAYLQVMLNNVPALKLYSKVGFTEIYKYWYRVK